MAIVRYKLFGKEEELKTVRFKTDSKADAFAKEIVDKSAIDPEILGYHYIVEYGD